jgi:hypothetical protein
VRRGGAQLKIKTLSHYNIMKEEKHTKNISLPFSSITTFLAAF